MFRIAVVCVCGCVSCTILKCGLEGLARELGMDCISVEVCEFRQMVKEPYDAVFCMSGLASCCAMSLGSSRIFEVTNAFDMQELRTLLRDAFAAHAGAGSGPA